MYCNLIQLNHYANEFLWLVACFFSNKYLPDSGPPGPNGGRGFSGPLGPRGYPGGAGNSYLMVLQHYIVDLMYTYQSERGE